MKRVDAEKLMFEGEALMQARSLHHAIDALQTAESNGVDADRCAAARWTARMLLGEFEGAWRESDAIRARGAADPHRFWQGESIAGRRVILRCLHGYGDAVQFLRFAPQLSDAASRLIVEVPPRLRKLACCFDGVGEVITWGEDRPTEKPNWDVQIECMELPYLFRTQITDLPVAKRYLRLSNASRNLVSHATGGRDLLRVGLVWTSGAWNTERSIPTRLLQPLIDRDDCEFWNLQGGPELPVRELFPGSARLREVGRSRDDMVALAEVISQLDLIISVDTLAAHLAGALGVPAWLLLRHTADWRWLHEREDSPWYPTLRLFRQRKEGEWKGVIDAVCEALSAPSSLLQRERILG